MRGGEIYQFGDFTLEPTERRLSQRGQPISVAPKAFDVLVALVRSAGSLVTKRQLLDAVWAGSFVEEGILAVHISALRRALGAGCIETVARSGYRFHAAVTRPAEAISLAVLPAHPLTAGILSQRDQSTGMALAAALADALGRQDQVLVRRQSLAAGGGDPASTGAALRVDAVVDTQFLRVGDRMRVAVRLLRSGDGACLWSGEFDEPIGQFAAITDAAAGRLAGHFGAPGPQLPPQPPIPAEVYELFGRGRAHLLAGSMFEAPKAVESFRAAIERSPEYAQAHAGLALAHCAMAELRAAPHAEAYAEARTAALRALAMDPLCADAQVALGAVLFLSDWNWEAASRSLERALELHPNHTEAYLLYGRLLDALSRSAEALAMKLKALERDPFSPLVHLQISMTYWNQRRYDDSIAWAQKALALDPRHPHAREHLAAARLKQGDLEGYMQENLRHAKAHGVPAAALEPFQRAYRAGGRAAIVKLIIEQAARQPQPAAALILAIHCAEAGDRDAAFEHLDRAIESRDPALVYLAVGPQWDDLRGDSRFGERLARMGLAGAAARVV